MRAYFCVILALLATVLEGQNQKLTAPFDNIIGDNHQEIIEYINAFPEDSYQVSYVNELGYFYCDPIDDVIKNVIREGLLWEPEHDGWIRFFARPGSIALDIGAHIGTHTLAMAQAVGPNGQVFAFEPQPKIFRELFMNMQLNKIDNVKFYWAGVSNHEGMAELSPLRDRNEGGTSLSGGTGKFVPLLTIDSLMLNNVSFMKIDVEGQEDQVLEGARETIARNRPMILIEIMGGLDIATLPAEFQDIILATIRKIQDMGYAVYQLRSNDYLAMPQQ